MTPLASRSVRLCIGPTALVGELAARGALRGMESEGRDEMSNRFAEILSFVPDPHGGFRQDRDYGWSTGSTWCSSEGMDMLVQQARIMEHWAGHFDALPLLRCMHGLTQSGFELTWSINDYICEPMKDPAHIDFMLAGWHEERCPLSPAGR